MNSLCVMLVFQASTYKCIGTIDSMYEGTNALDHPLVDQLLERFIKANEAHIIQEFCPKARIQ